MSTRSNDPFKAAEAVFAKKREPDPKPAGGAIPAGREQVTLRIDRDVLEHFQADGPGWQDRINDALRTLVDRG
jgi:uncharacterized protein (DUF4415 family)